MSKLKFVLLITSCFFVQLFAGCKKDVAISNYKTKNIIIIVVDGPRYSETWGSSSRALIPFRNQLLQQGAMCNHFYNNGATYTNPGHSAIVTGNYENIDNTGQQLPLNPSIFQYFNKKMENNNTDNTWLVTSKDKLTVLANCRNGEWNNHYMPNTDCGVNGLNSGYRHDSITFAHVQNVIGNKHPNLMLINFREPDFSGHLADSMAYINGIINTDFYINEIWKQIQADDFYANKTTLIVSNDHGRHLDGVSNGYISHGDNCEGCKHIEFFAIGPDFKSNFVCADMHEQIDISSTVAELLQFEMPTSKGKVMRCFFK
jgi:Type I phosphodiesterase / nucleotide pyrophosphatase